MNTLDFLDKIKENYLILNEDKVTKRSFSKKLNDIFEKYRDDPENLKNEIIKIKLKIKSENKLDSKDAYRLYKQLKKLKIKLKEEQKQAQKNNDDVNSNLFSDCIKALTNLANTIDKKENAKKENENETENDERLKKIKNFFITVINNYQNWKKYHNDKGNFKEFIEKLRSYNGKQISEEGKNGKIQLSVDISEEFLNNIKE